ncbi:50S ribosomal protein L28 [Buchnera aphidicola]|uniref:50S ribosomal protein L28 n=1 Tax=Buchnera aphidicola TaxID=9 RepID=UPI0030EDC7E0
MSKICQLTKKKSMFGNKRSHALNSSKRRFYPNIKKKKFWSFDKKRFVKLKISNKGTRIINKKGIDTILKNI